MKCPQCSTTLLSQNINIQDNIAKCSNCDNIFKASEGLDSFDNKFNITQPPSGSWYEQDVDKIIVGATTRNAIAFFLIPFTIVWAGLSLGSIYGSQISTQEFSLSESLFGLPFLIGSLFMLKSILMATFGKVELRLDRNGVIIFTGIGSIGRKQTFHWRDVSTINNGITRPWYQRYDEEAIVIEGASSIVLGTDLNEQRRYYLLNALKKMKAQYS